MDQPAEHAEHSEFSLIDHLRAIPGYCKRLFPERQIFYRVRGEIQFVTFKAIHQFAVFLALVGVVAWVSFSSMHYMAFDWMLQAQREVNNLMSASDFDAAALDAAFADLRAASEAYGALSHQQTITIRSVWS